MAYTPVNATRRSDDEREEDQQAVGMRGYPDGICQHRVGCGQQARHSHSAKVIAEDADERSADGSSDLHDGDHSSTLVLRKAN